VITLKSFGMILKEIRKTHHMSQKELGGRLGVGQTTIANYEKDIRFPNQESLMVMADIFDISVDQLLGRESIEKNKELKDEEELRNKLLALLIKGNEREAIAIVKNIKMTEHVIIRLYENVFKPLLYEVGDLWENGQISIAKEHYISECVWRMVSYVSESIERKTPTKGSVLCMALSGEQHTLGIRMVADYFNILGYQPYYIGANIPTGEVIRFVEQIRPEFIALSLTSESLNDSLVNLIQRLKETCESCKIIVGGQAFEKNQTHVPKDVNRCIDGFESLEKMLRSADEI